MPKVSIRNGNGSKAGTTKYDAHHKVLSQTYGAFADLRRELSDSKETVGGREELLKTFATCPDSQRAWLLLEDYFEKLSLSRRDFPASDWWPRLLAAQGEARLEELAFLFLRAKRSLPTELAACANLDRTLHLISQHGCKPGVVVNPATPVELLTEVLDLVHHVLVMSVNPGFGGQKFIPNSLNKIAALARMRAERKLDFRIEVDGGIDLTTVADVVKAGAELLVVGTGVFGHGDIRTSAAKLLEAARSATLTRA
jgi:hypothetical protein